MSLFCDVQSSGNSLVAIKRRMQSVTRGEKIKHEVRNSLGLENFGAFLSVKPFGFFPVLQGECNEQTNTLLAGSYLQLLFGSRKPTPEEFEISKHFSDEQVTTSVLRDLTINLPLLCERIRYANNKYLELLKRTKSDNHLMSRIINLSEAFLDAEKTNKNLVALSLYQQVNMNQRSFLETLM